MKDTEKTKQQLIEELKALRRRLATHELRDDESITAERSETRRKLQNRLRKAISRMQHSDDIVKLLSVLREGLQQLGMRFDDCDINLIYPHRDSPMASMRGRAQSSEWDLPETTLWGEQEVLRFWRDGVTVYRRDLQKEDPYGELPGFMEHFDHAVRSVVDIPFSYGTLALNSRHPEAFSAADIADLEQLVLVLEDGFRRRADLERAEARTVELEREIGERRQVEQALVEARRWDQAESAVRLEIARMEHPQDLLMVVRTVDTQLRNMGVVFDDLSLQVVDADGADFACITVILEEGVPVCDWSKTAPKRMNAQAYPWVMEVWRTQTLRYEPCAQDRYMPAGISVVDVPFSHGTLAINAKRSYAFSDDDIAAVQRLAAVLSDGFQRFLDLTERERALRRIERENKHRMCLDQVRDLLLRLVNAADLDNLMSRIWETLRTLEVPHSYFGINTIAADGQVLAHIMDHRGDWAQRKVSVGQDIIREIWKKGEVAYRPDLQKTDAYHELPRLQQVRAVLDVPFSHGTLSLSSTMPNAFTDEDVELLSDLARVLSQAFTRLENITRLQESEARFRSLFQAMSDGVCLQQVSYDAAGKVVGCRIVDANARYQEIFGGVPTEAGQADPPGACDPCSARFLEAYAAVEKSGDAVHFETRCSFLDRHFRVTVVSRGAGETAALFEDITERKRVERERALALSLQRLRNEIFQMQGSEDWMSVGTCLYSELGTLIRFRQCSINIVDAKTRSFHSYHVDSQRPAADRELRVPAAIAQAMDSGRPVLRANRVQMQQFDDHVPPEIHCIVDVPFAGGTLAVNSEDEDAFTTTDLEILERFARVMAEGLQRLEDIVRHERMEREIRRTNNLESLGLLAGGIAHDFNNVITGVTGNLELLERLLETGTTEHELAREAQQAASRTRGLTQQLMTFAKGGAPITESASVEELIRQTTELCLRGANTKAIFRFAPDLRQVQIDTGQIGQVIQNLVINADQAMPGGGILTVSADNIQVSTADDLPIPAGAYVKVTVADEGTGISAAVLQKIFDPYFTTKESGHGLGLSITHSIIQRHGGHISVHSEIDVGTTFELYLPAAAGEVAAGPKARKELAEGSGRILLMDDEEIIRRTLSRALGMLGYEVECAAEGNQALATYRHAMEQDTPFDLVIMDLTIPGAMGGKEAVVELLALDPAARVLVSSGYSNDPVMANFAEYGFVGRITKPVRITDLATTVQRALQGRVSP